MKYFREEYIEHIEEKKCKTGECKALAKIQIDPEKCRGCEEMSISSTVLSRDEFIAKLDTYYGNNASSYGSTFKENAGKIYDLATRNGINPELIVVKAEFKLSIGYGVILFM